MAAHRPPYGDGNSISGYNLFVSAYHGFAQLGNEHSPTPRRFEAYPIFSLDFVGAEMVSLFDVKLQHHLSENNVTYVETDRSAMEAVFNTLKDAGYEVWQIRQRTLHINTSTLKSP